MPLFRHALLAVAMTLASAGACLGADRAVAANEPPTAGATAIPDVLDTQLSADYWVARLPDADRVVLDRTAIDARNRTLLRVDPSMHDLTQWPATLTRAQVTAMLAKVSKRPTTPLFGVDGQPLAGPTLDAVLANDAPYALPDRITPRYGMAVRRTPLRSHATALRVFSRPGDTDIDRFQESTLFPGDPVAVVHTSADGAWVFAVSTRYAAWTPADGIAYGSAAQVFAHADATPYRIVTGAAPRTVFTPEAPALSALPLDMGTRVPLDTTLPPDQPVNGQHPYTSWVLSLPVRDAQGQLSFHPALLQRNQPSAADYLPLTRANIIRQAFRFLGERYGWGHDFDGRDCSGFVSDVYRSMGVQMPRNTGDQASSPGLAHTLYTDKDSHEARLAAAMALDVGDLVYIPGHVMMVIGKVDGKPYVIHDVSGIGLRQDGGLRRITLNEVAVTPLLPLMFDERTSFLDRMTSIVRIR